MRIKLRFRCGFLRACALFLIRIWSLWPYWRMGIFKRFLCGLFGYRRVVDRVVVRNMAPLVFEQVSGCIRSSKLLAIDLYVRIRNVGWNVQLTECKMVGFVIVHDKSCSKYQTENEFILTCNVLNKSTLTNVEPLILKVKR